MLGKQILEAYQGADDSSRIQNIKTDLKKDMCKCFIRGLKPEIEQRISRNLDVQCDKTGHSAKDCWKKQNEQRNRSQPLRTVCQICNNYSHTAKECRLNQSRSISGSFCRYCKEPGHFLENCELRIASNNRRKENNQGNFAGPSKTGVPQGTERGSHPLAAMGPASKLKLADYEVIYKAGKTNVNADALSRNPVNLDEENCRVIKDQKRLNPNKSEDADQISKWLEDDDESEDEEFELRYSDEEIEEPTLNNDDERNFEKFDNPIDQTIVEICEQPTTINRRETRNQAVKRQNQIEEGEEDHHQRNDPPDKINNESEIDEETEIKENDEESEEEEEKQKQKIAKKHELKKKLKPTIIDI
ncbi:nucleolin-like [Pseudomyrmex gracilis]|uniref:nucleolin-like n=1 Tax=Pseudomyrmex gracilis TaxID=219809 RepID=UPI000995AAE5|nr:nucleolin-like [Pseudomyrmex gracilis]